LAPAKKASFKVYMLLIIQALILINEAIQYT